jgi:hypothetical protein
MIILLGTCKENYKVPIFEYPVLCLTDAEVLRSCVLATMSSNYGSPFNFPPVLSRATMATKYRSVLVCIPPVYEFWSLFNEGAQNPSLSVNTILPCRDE